MLRYSEIPRDVSGESLLALRVSENHDHPCTNGKSEETKSYFGVSAFSPFQKDGTLEKLKKGIQKVSSGPGPPISYYNYGGGAELAALDTMSVPPEDFSSQLTLLDLAVFTAISPDELSSCGWNKRNKLTVAPNVVAFTRRFNHVSFWTVQEVLRGPTAKQRAEVLAHFIRIARKLYELNNLHSLFAIISALQSASVYRLAKTWGCVSRKERQTFDRLAEVFSDSNNWSNLRAHMQSLRLPCIPYLGLFLTDLVYIDMAHPHSGGLESQQRRLKMNNILRVISSYQLSSYGALAPLPRVQRHLNSVRYIEELQKFVEDDNYKLSLRLEPPSPAPSSSSCSSKESVAGAALDPAVLASLNLSPARASSGSLRLHPPAAAAAGPKFIPSHRKCRSLGTKFRSASLPRNIHRQGLFGAGPGAGPAAALGMFSRTRGAAPAADSPDCGKALHLLDDSVLEDSGGGDGCGRPSQPPISPGGGAHLALALRAAPHAGEEESAPLARCADAAAGADADDEVCALQGCLRRKTVLKAGRKPAVASWQRYWLQLWGSSLVYFAPKSFKGFQRSDFKREPCKVVSVAGCSLDAADGAAQPDTFQLLDPHRGNVYKFRAGSRANADKWSRVLQDAARCGAQGALPVNLMSFE